MKSLKVRVLILYPHFFSGRVVMEIKKLIVNGTEELISLYKDFHAHPELGFQEFRTQKVIIKYLTQLGLHAQRIASTGVFATLQGRQSGPTILLRTDMDAIPVTEKNRPAPP